MKVMIVKELMTGDVSPVAMFFTGALIIVKMDFEKYKYFAIFFIV